MTSVSRFLKQIPSDAPYFVSLLAAARGADGSSTGLSVNYFVQDSDASTRSYNSYQLNGQMFPANVTTTPSTIFRDMGRTVVSSGRTFRRVQLLTGVLPSATASWVPNSGGLTAGNNTANVADANFNCYYFEVGGIAGTTGGDMVRYG